MNIEKNEILLDDLEVIDYNPIKKISNVSEFATPLLEKAEMYIEKSKKILFTLPQFVELVRSTVSKKVFETVLSTGDSVKLATGTVEIMTKKDGSFLAALINPQTKKIIKQIPLREIKITPQLGQALTSFANQLQMAKVIGLIEDVQKEVGNVLRGLENDRIAGALSCKQKYLQAMKISNPSLKKDMLIRIIMDAEDTRNQLMLSQRENLNFIDKLPKTFTGKMLSRDSNQKKIDDKLLDIKKGLQAINLTSIVEVMAYDELGEIEAAKTSLLYYSNHIATSFLSKKNLVNRLDELSEKPYWKDSLKNIHENILKLNNMRLIEGGNENGKDKMQKV